VGNKKNRLQEQLAHQTRVGSSTATELAHRLVNWFLLLILEKLLKGIPNNTINSKT
jgi:hypothetical protein